MDRTRKRKADSAAENGTTPSKRQKIPDLSPEDVSELGLKLVETLKNAKDRSGRYVAELFVDLPRKKDVPDYYDVIKLPIAISTVERKLRDEEYATLSEIESDFHRMVANAKQYNDDESEVYEDAERVRKLLHNWMKTHNPAHKDPNYAPFPTPLEEEVKEPKRPTITLSKGRRTSEMKVKPSVETPAAATEAPTNEFEGKTFGEVQIQIMDEFVQWKDEEDFAEFQPFINLPPRTLTDYYQLIKKPMCLKMVIKRARGQHGREAATGVTDFKTWDAFENEVSLIWKNAQDYNEDGSEMYDLAERFKEEFLARLAEVKTKVDEPQSARIKLNARPKPVLHLGARTAPAEASPAISADVEPEPEPKQPATDTQTPARSASQDTRAISTQPLIKTEAPAATPRPDSVQPVQQNGDIEAAAATAPVQPSATPQPPAPYVPVLAPAPPTFAETYARSRPVADALLPSISIRTHPALTVKQPLSLTVAASPSYTNHSVTLMLPQTQYHLQILPQVSAPLARGERQYKLFVSVNGTRISPSTRLTEEKRTSYDVPLTPGVNRVEVEVVAPALRGGTGLEGEKVVVLANLMRY